MKYSRRTVYIIGCILLIAGLETAVFILFSPQHYTISPPLLSVTAEEAREYIKSKENLFVIDVRTYKEYMGAHLREAVNLPLHALPERYGEIPGDRPVLLHCIYGVRAIQAYKLLRRLRPDIQDIRYVTGQLIPVTSDNSGE